MTSRRRAPDPRNFAVVMVALTSACASKPDAPGSGTNATTLTATPGNQDLAAVAAAGKALQTMSQLSGLPKSTFTEDSLADLNLSLGQGLPVLIVRLDSLKVFDANKAPETLLTPIPRIAFPVLNDGQIRSSLVIERDSTWHLASLAAIDFKAIADRLAAGTSVAGGRQQRLVTIPALESLSFLAESDPGGLMLIPIETRPRYNLVAGQAVRASPTFVRLALLARDIDPNVPR